MDAVKIKFERIGRTGTTPAAALTLDVGPCETEDQRDQAAETAFRHVRKHLASRDGSVVIDFDLGEVTIEGGRFGRGKLVSA